MVLKVIYYKFEVSELIKKISSSKFRVFVLFTHANLDSVMQINIKINEIICLKIYPIDYYLIEIYLYYSLTG